MYCSKVLTNVDFGNAKRSCFVLVPDENVDQKHQVLAELLKYATAEDTAELFLSWAEGGKSAVVVLVSLDRKFATLRESNKKDNLIPRDGETLLEFWSGPIAGLEKCEAVLMREIGLLPEECKKFGYTPKFDWPKLPQRSSLKGWAEFNPVFHAQIRGSIQNTYTFSLIWMYMVAEKTLASAGIDVQDIFDELKYRISNGFPELDAESLPKDVFKPSGLTELEIKHRKTRALAYLEYIDWILQNSKDEDDEKAISAKLKEAIYDLDLALELYVALSWNPESNPHPGFLGGILWNIICNLSATSGSKHMIETNFE